MRHLSLPLILSGILISACDLGKPKVQQEQERTSYTQESAVIPPCAVTTQMAPVKPLHRPKTTVSDLGPMIPEEQWSDGAIVTEEIKIQAEEERPADERKTYNERQLSDDVDDYPLDKSDRGQTYNETQLSR